MRSILGRHSAQIRLLEIPMMIEKTNVMHRQLSSPLKPHQAWVSNMASIFHPLLCFQFLNYLSRIHREEDFDFVLRGVTRLLMNPLAQTYLPHSQRKVQLRLLCHDAICASTTGSFSDRSSSTRSCWFSSGSCASTIASSSSSC